MTMPHNPFGKSFLAALLALLTMAALSGCAVLGLDKEEPGPIASSSSPEAPPYRANEFTDLLIPNELSWDREKSMLVRTESFAGGVLHYSGRVDIASLSDFFTNSMTRNGWKLAGSAKYKNILLAFTKPGKTCTILLSENKLLMKTDADIYMAEDVSTKGLSGKTPSSPFGHGM